MALVLLVSCKKDDAETSILGRWTVESIAVKEYLNNNLDDSYTEPGFGTTIEFFNNGTVVTTVPGSTPETNTYSLQSGSKVEIDGETYDIKVLTKNDLQLFGREDYGPGEYTEVTLNMER